ncbi:3'-5' exoribonuclease YhaM family protein [Lactococcus allomyrinae]|uniref:HD domain-containing protein n=1 Tax=Lactococcus allomyrinae TaxID=2419773 RepID=A0A387BR85_9LACT|nr:3'-5' exoribonuclease YhaM family protein [Lactococcus allomyrinae]AYG00981.1 HD domain-containing protein [Lactococcus allomyrinae]
MVLIKNLELGEFFEGFYLIKSVELRQTRAGKDYLAISFQDRTGTISGNIWDANNKAVEQFRAGKVVHMKALKELYNGMPQVNKIQLRLATDSEPNNSKDYREKSPVNEADLREYVQSIVFKIENGTWNRIVRSILKKFDKEFYEFPAAKTNHHAFEGGLAYHTTTMLQLAEKICEVYPQLNSSLMFAGVLLHDMAKCLEFTGFENTSYTLRGNLLGHIVLIDEEVSKAALELGIGDEKEDLLLLRHCLLSHHGELEYGSPIRPQIMEAEMIHQIDMMDASMMMMETATANLEPGQFSQRVWALDNRNFYKPKID